MNRGICAAAGFAVAAAVAAHAGGTFVYEPGPAPLKAYVKELYTPGGVQVLLDSPPDHVHHHGLMFALGVDGADFWSEVPADKYGRQQPRAEGASEVRKSAAGGPVTQTLDWIAGGTNLLVEARSVSMAAGAGGAPSVLTWRSRVQPAEGRGTARLWGRHYFGLGLRLVRDLDGKAVFVFPAGSTNRPVRGTEIMTPAPWCAVQGEIGGRAVTVAMFDDPRNLRHPNEWFTMTQPFAYVGATLELEHQPFDLAAGKPLDLRWGVALWDGTADAGAVQKEYDRWAKSDNGVPTGVKP